MKYLILVLTITVFTGSYFVLKAMYNGGKGKGAESIATMVLQEKNSGLSI